eukprot:TRINITY_DN5254_c0_g1_i4.p1 TRINITY_DN5254_c0_g1~~TRINITY_DN5254_c0_g1_i4.p1  ORF type:complete len:404 (-),score=95.09 TRINITY_DN5254_c0_g1_i4:111-1322(-)
MNAFGKSSVVEGPAVPFLFLESIELLKQITAYPGQYLIVEHKNGNRTHIPGPATEFFNPVLHKSIAVAKALTIETGQAVVIYKATKIPGEEQARVTTEILYGPATRVLQSNEWLHQFSWQVPVQDNPKLLNRKMLKFFKLRTVPDQISFTVPNVRTKDDAILQVKLMIFYHLLNVESMMASTHDPCAELINGLTADVVDFASDRSFENFKKDCHLLNKIGTFHQTQLRLSTLGYTISKIVFCGVDEPTALQEMHNSAIETRTSLQLKVETEHQAQDLESYKLACKRERIEKELDLEKQGLLHQQEMEEKKKNMLFIHTRKEHEQSLKMEMELAEMKNATLKTKLKIEEEHERTMNEIASSHYQQLKEIGVDVTAYLVAKNTSVDKTLRILGSDNLSTNLHFNQ